MLQTVCKILTYKAYAVFLQSPYDQLCNFTWQLGNYEILISFIHVLELLIKVILLKVIFNCRVFQSRASFCDCNKNTVWNYSIITFHCRLPFKSLKYIMFLNNMWSKTFKTLIAYYFLMVGKSFIVFLHFK